MKKNVILIILLLPILLFGQNVSIDFKEGTLEEALRDAKQSGKPLFLYVHSDACYPCRVMEKNVFPDKEVSSYYNTTFVDYKINFDEDRGKVLEKQFRITFVPTYLYFDEDGVLLHKSGSGKSAQAFIQDGKNALDSPQAYISLKNKYYRGDRSTEFIYNFSNTLLDVSDSPDIRNEVVEVYLQSLNKDVLSSKDLDYIVKQTQNINDASAKYYFNMQKPISQLIGEEAMQKKNRGLIGNAADEAGIKNDTVQINYIKQLINESGIANHDQLMSLTDVRYFLSRFLKEKNKWNQYADAAIEYGRKYAAKDNHTLYEAAFYINYYSDNKAALQKALKIINIAISGKKTYNNLLLKTKILHKSGKKKEALAIVQQAIQSASPEDDTGEAKDLMEKIKKSKR
ncbi:MAG: hypothetical protein BGP13_21685 [Sphingobacteriales bacterium 40-81]|nr:MAG: hypothetical protein BGP13_21685 [Sphingobacteriales bacterium 40-81]